MMTISATPNRYQGADTEPIFTIQGVDTTQQTIVEIHSDTLHLGTKRFVALPDIDVCVAGYARRLIDIAPPTAQLAIVPLEASAEIYIKCGALSSTKIPITLSAKSTMPLNTPLSDAPSHSTTTSSATIFLSLIATAQPRATLTMLRGDVPVEFALECDAWQGEGIYCVVVDFDYVATELVRRSMKMEEFYGATLTILTAEGLLERHYTFIGDEGTTICWLNSYGVPESYTFTKPILWQENTTRYIGQSCRAQRTLSTTSRQVITVATPLLPAEHLLWLKDIERSTEVWIRQGTNYTRIEVDKLTAQIKSDGCASARLTILPQSQIRRAL